MHIGAAPTLRGADRGKRGVDNHGAEQWISRVDTAAYSYFWFGFRAFFARQLAGGRREN